MLNGTLQGAEKSSEQWDFQFSDVVQRPMRERPLVFDGSPTDGMVDRVGSV